MNAVVVGIGASLPKRCMTNFDFSSDLCTSDEWISKRTGIKQRYIVSESETTASLATAAAVDALKHAKLTEDKIDLIIVGTVTGDYTFPSVATIVQRNLGITRGFAFDVSAACSGFIYALDIANLYIRSGRAKCALVIGAETFSRILDWHDRSSCVLFGDGAGAVVLQAQDTTDIGIQYCSIHSDGKYVDTLRTTGGVSTTSSSGTILMDGRSVFKFAVEIFTDSLKKLLEDNKMTIDDVDLLIPHQANYRIINKLIENSGIEENKVVITVDKQANTSAATIPLAMNTVRDIIFTKKNVVLLSMGAGFTWGSTLIRF